MIAYIRGIRRHQKSDEGASAVEYGLLVAAIAAVIVVIVFALGGLVKNKFKDTCDSISGKGDKTAVQTGDCNDGSTP
jgi:pilus assembly protein Flp/PilA